MTDPRAIYIFPEGADLAPLKAAVLELALPYPTRPFWFRPGVPAPVIDLDGTFDHLHEHLRPKTHESMKLAVLHCLGEKELDKGPRRVIDRMKAILGDDVKEVYDEWPESE